MNRVNVISREIIVVLFVASVLVGATIGVSLYNSALKSNEENLIHIASSVSRLLASVAEFDRAHSDNDGIEGGPAGATLLQVHNALSGNTGIGSTGEILLLTAKGEAIQILAHQELFDRDHDHPDMVPPGSEYYDTLRRGLLGELVVSNTVDDHKHKVVLAFSPVAGTDWTVATERHVHELTEPFIQAGMIGAGIALLFIFAGGFYNYRIANQIGKIAISAEQKAELKQRQLEEALDVMNDGFALFDKDDRLVLCNQVYRDFYSTHDFSIEVGKSLEDILRAGCSVGAFPQAVGREEDWIKERLVQHQATQTVEQKLADGRWLKISEKRTKDGGIVGVRTDISDLIIREQALQMSFDRFKDFTDTASDWVWETDAQHRFSYTERGSRLESNFDPDLINMLTREEAAAEDTNTEKWQRHREALAARAPFRDFRYWTIAPNTSKRLIAVSGNPVFEDDSVFLGYRGTGRDVTEEYFNFKKLNDTELMRRLIFEKATVGLIHADAQGEIIAFNETAQQIFGYAADEAVGQNVSILMPEEHSQFHSRYMENYFRTGDAKVIGIGREFNGRRKDGEEFPLHIGIAEVTAGDEIQIIASIVDLSKERLLEAQLRQSQKMDAVGQMVGGVAHDFNNLLGIILGNLELMQRKIEPDSKLERQLDKAVRAAKRGTNLTRRLLSFSRQAPTASDTVNVNEAIQSLHELLQKSFTEKVKLELSLRDDLPNALADQGDLEDAITNICINARDAMPDGGTIAIETSTIDVAANQASELRDLEPGRYIEIDVSDTGLGMPRDVVAHIFEPFFSTKEIGKGTGLGLSMVYGFVKRSSGTISVYSEPGFGTTFKMFLPVATEVVANKANVEKQYEQVAPRSQHGRILVVDDEQDLAEVAVTVLNELGYETAVAYNGNDALEVLRSDPEIILLFTDVIMPGDLDGYALASKALELKPNLKVCLSSGFTGLAIKSIHQTDQSFPILKKPYTNQALSNKILEIFSS